MKQEVKVMVFISVWEFHVKPGHEDEFVRMNREERPRLFRRSKGYSRTVVTRDGGDASAYWVIDVWDSRNGLDGFMEGNRRVFDEMDAMHREHYVSSRHVGFYE